MAYTSTVLSTSTKWVLALLLLATSLSAQVRVVIPKRHYQPQEQIPAKLENQTSRPITVCVQFGQWSPKGDTIGSTPSPFLVERNDSGKWSILLNGPDVGTNPPNSFRHFHSPSNVNSVAGPTFRLFPVAEV